MNGKKLPTYIVDALIYSGFDTKIALSSIKSEDINAIEQFVNENPDKFVESFKTSIYENIKPFKLIPGHRALILNIPTVLKENSIPKKAKAIRIELNENELKETLISKIQSYEQNNGYEFKITIDQIERFQKNDEEYKCHVKCSFCAKSFLCTYKTYWNNSNLIKHLKTHFQIIEMNSVRANRIQNNADNNQSEDESGSF